MNANNIVSVINLIKNYGEGAGMVKALQDVSFDIEKGEFVAIMGTSGSGKSTLLHMLGGIDRPNAGKVFINNVNITELAEDELVKFRRDRIGYVFQDFHLIPILTVKENVYLPAGLADNSRGLLLPGRLSMGRMYFWQMNQPVIWIKRTVTE